MKLPHSAALLLVLAGAAPLAAQRPPTPQAQTRADALRAARTYPGFGAPVLAAAGTRVALQPRWMDAACIGPGGGCLVAQGSPEGGAGLAVQLGDGSVRGARAMLRVEHDRPHTLGVSLDGSEVMGFSCNGRAVRLRAPGGTAFRWAVYHGEQRVDGGTSPGDPVDVPNPKHAGPGGGPMQLSVQHRDPAQLAGASDAWCKKYGCMQLALTHGDHRIVVMPVLERSTPFALRELGVRVTGAGAFALSGLEVDRRRP